MMAFRAIQSLQPAPLLNLSLPNQFTPARSPDPTP